MWNMMIGSSLFFYDALLLSSFLIGYCLFFGLLVGGGPTATYFLCFVKESKQRKTTASLALRVPVCAAQKMGNE
jgi:hypothetical protein